MAWAGFVDDEIAGAIDALAGRSGHRLLAVWAADCARRGLPLFEASFPEDQRPRKAIRAARKRARDGIFRMAYVRKTALDSHAAARKAPIYIYVLDLISSLYQSTIPWSKGILYFPKLRLLLASSS